MEVVFAAFYIVNAVIMKRVPASTDIMESNSEMNRGGLIPSCERPFVCVCVCARVCIYVYMHTSLASFVKPAWLCHSIAML